MIRMCSLAAICVLLLGAANSPIDVTTSNWKFTPDAIVLHVGQPTLLRLTSSEGVHGIKSDELGIPLTTLTPGKIVALQVTPRKAGTFVLHCAIICGPGHSKMTLTVTVESK